MVFCPVRKHVQQTHPEACISRVGDLELDAAAVPNPSAAVLLRGLHRKAAEIEAVVGIRIFIQRNGAVGKAPAAHMADHGGEPVGVFCKQDIDLTHKISSQGALFPVPRSVCPAPEPKQDCRRDSGSSGQRQRADQQLSHPISSLMPSAGGSPAHRVYRFHRISVLSGERAASPCAVGASDRKNTG